MVNDYKGRPKRPAASSGAPGNSSVEPPFLCKPYLRAGADLTIDVPLVKASRSVSAAHYAWAVAFTV